jgi:flavodoxin I
MPIMLPMKIGLFYGSTSRNTKAAAEKIRDRLGGERLAAFRDIKEIDVHDLEGYDVLILGIPTWNVGELQQDWDAMFPRLDEIDLAGTRVAVFGLGDVGAYPDTYQDALGILYGKLLERGASGGVGFWPTEGYDHFESKAIVDGAFCGLCLDEETEPELSDERIDRWCAQLEQELGLA